MLTLIIRTSVPKQVVLKLVNNQDIVAEQVIDSLAPSQQILKEIELILQKKSLMLQDLNSIQLDTNPGSYTGLRVGAVTAQTLSLLLKIPINGLPPGSLPTIKYPNDKWKLP